MGSQKPFEEDKNLLGKFAFCLNGTTCIYETDLLDQKNEAKQISKPSNPNLCEKDNNNVNIVIFSNPYVGDAKGTSGDNLEDVGNSPRSFAISGPS